VFETQLCPVPYLTAVSTGAVDNAVSQ